MTRSHRLACVFVAGALGAGALVIAADAIAAAYDREIQLWQYAIVGLLIGGAADLLLLRWVEQGERRG